MSKSGAFGYLQKLGKALMVPVAVMPAAAILLRIGSGDVLNLPWMAAAGSAIFSNLALIFAIGIAVGLAKDNNGVAAIAAAVGYYTITMVATTFDKTINMGVLAGILIGILSAELYNKFNAIKLPNYLGFFGGRRFVPIITSFSALALGVVSGYVWPTIQKGINFLGNGIVDSGTIGAFIFGLINRALIPFGLHHVLNTLCWFEFGSFTDAAGTVFKGDINRFLNGDVTAGMFQTGFFPIMMFALPAACFAMIAAAKPKNRKAVTGLFIGIALTAFLTGITEPIEFTFLFIAPVLYGIHAVLTGVSLAVCTALGIHDGFGFSAGLIDYVINFNIAQKPILLIVVGLVFAVIYFVIFYWFIKKYDLPTPGRVEDEESEVFVNLDKTDLYETGLKILNAIGGSENIVSIDACITRIRVTTKNGTLLNEADLKRIGANGVMKMGANNFQIVVGTMADPIVTNIKRAMKEIKVK